MLHFIDTPTTPEKTLSHAERIALEAAAAQAGEVIPALALPAVPQIGWAIKGAK